MNKTHLLKNKFLINSLLITNWNFMKNVKTLFHPKSCFIKSACLITKAKISFMSILKDLNLILISLILIIKIARKCMRFLKKPYLFIQKMLILTRELTRKFLNFLAQITKYKILICKIFKKVWHPKILRI